jgi:hypothetical protein
MVSTVKYNALPKLSFDSLKQKPLFIGFVVVSIAMLIISKGEFLFYVFFVLVLFGIFRKVFEWISNSSNDDSIAEETN